MRYRDIAGFALASCTLIGASGAARAFAQDLGPLQDRLRDFAQANNMRPFATPTKQNGIALGSILDAQDAVRATGCWRISSVAEPGLDTVQLGGVITRGGGFNLGLSILNLFGIHIGAGANRVDTLSLSFGRLSVADAADASFNWTNKNCLSTARKAPIRVLDRLLTVGSLHASLATADSGRIAVDSADVIRKGVTVTVNANLSHTTKNGVTLVSGDSVAIARAVHQWKVNRIVCGGEHLPLGQGLQAPTGCPNVATDDGWYRARLKSGPGQSLTIVVQAIGVPGAAPTDFTVTPGADFILDTLAQRVDLGRVDSTATGYALTVTRFEIRRDNQLLAAPTPLTRNEATALVRLENLSAPSK